MSGLVEIKCPNTATHIEFLMTGTVPEKYLLQMQWQMACTETDWCDYVSYDPRMPVELQTKIVRVERDNALIAKIEGEVSKFLSELDAKIASLEAMR